MASYTLPKNIIGKKSHFCNLILFLVFVLYNILQILEQFSIECEK